MRGNKLAPPPQIVIVALLHSLSSPSPNPPHGVEEASIEGTDRNKTLPGSTTNSVVLNVVVISAVCPYKKGHLSIVPHAHIG